ncbi:MAG: PD-(D/E)XK nuclease family protein [Phycisphaerales bacterium]
MSSTANISATHFMGWDQPALISASHLIIKQYQESDPDHNDLEIDLSARLIVVSGRRASRGLLGALVDRAAELGLALIPPQIVTPLDLPALLLQLPANQATESHRRIAWIQTLSEMSTVSPDRINALLPSPPSADQWDQWINIADWLDQLTDELSQSCLRMDSVLDNAGLSTKLQLDESEVVRWEILGEIQTSYELKLHDNQYVDARLAALAGHTDHAVHADHPYPHNNLYNEDPSELPIPLKRASHKHIILCCVPDLTRLSKSIFNRVISTTGTQLQSLVFAPESCAEYFDDLGLVLTEHWSTCELPISEDRIHFAQTTEDLCQFALAKLGSIAEPIETSQAVIGLADESLASPLQRQAALIENPTGQPVNIHTPAGHHAHLTAPGQLLKRIRAFLQEDSFESLVDLVLHPDINDALTHLRESQGDDRTPKPDAFWLKSLDALRDQHLQSSPTSLPNTAQEWIQSDARWVMDATLELLAPMKESPHQAPLNNWMPRLIRCYQLIYAATELNDLPESSTLVQSLESINQACTHISQAHADGFELPHLTAHEALSFVIAELSQTRFPEHIDREAIESIGWLELAMDPAPHAVIIGMNDSSIPGSITHDPILPSSLREALAMRTNADRLARDAYLMQSINESRDAHFACTRIGSNNEPTIPSRLLLKTSGKALAMRIQRFVDHEHPLNTNQPTIELVSSESSSDTDPFSMKIVVQDGYTPPESMSVTDFDAYLRSPAAWYIERHLGLKEPITNGKELSHMHIGNLVHAVFEEYGKSTEYRDLCDEQQIYTVLTSLLESNLHNQHGSDLMPAVRIQYELLKYRLQWFASQQAARASLGWKIIHTEWSPAESQQPSLMVDDQPMKLRGKIDRIDQHSDGRIAIIDYKTGQVSDAAKGHLKGEQWIKLQLPLYRHLAKPLFEEPSISAQHIELGYAGLPSHSDAKVWSFACWSAEDLEQADEAASHVIREIRALTPGQALPLGDFPPEHGIKGFISGRRFSGGGGEPTNDTIDSDSIIAEDGER